jgi:uncharacterized protein YfiM (DUF2279 family)
MMRRVLSALLLSAVTVGCAAVVLSTPARSPERVAAALLLLLALPGTAAASALRARTGSLTGSTALMCGALSIAIVILVSGGLYAVGIRLDARSWTIAVGSVTILLSAAGAITSRTLVPRRWSRPPALRVLFPLLAGALIAGCLLAGATLATVDSVRHRDQADRFTQLWALPAAGGTAAAEVGVSNHQSTSERYTLRVSVNGRPADRRIVNLRSGQSWTAQQDFPAGTRTVRVTLSLAGSTSDPYRWVELHFAG